MYKVDKKLFDLYMEHYAKRISDCPEGYHKLWYTSDRRRDMNNGYFTHEMCYWVFLEWCYNQGHFTPEAKKHNHDTKKHLRELLKEKK